MTESIRNTLPGQFDFGLSEAQEMRAARLHREGIVFDMLSMYAGGRIFEHYPEDLQAEFFGQLAAAATRSEVLSRAIYWPFEMAKIGKSNLIRDWLQQSGLTCGAYSIEDFTHGAADPLSCNWDENILGCAQLPWLRYVTTAAEIREAKREGVMALYANCQPVVPVLRDLKPFEAAYRKGLRSFMLTYNRMDHIGVGCTERVDAGLSMFGVEVVEHCNKLGIIIDVSHCGHLTTLDACRYSRKPVTANHTAARSIHMHARGKSNEALRAIADTGGVIGVLAVPYFLSGEPAPTIERMLDHIDFIANLVGWQHVAIGTDWPWPVPEQVLSTALGREYDEYVGFREEDRIDRRQQLTGFEDCRDLPNITRGLVKRGYSDEQILAILGENALRVFEEVCG